jgi:hypothetical protein
MVDLELAAMRNRLFAMVLVLVATACTKPYESPVIEAAEGAPMGFPGLADQIEVARSAGRSLRVIVVHGMCDHDRDWALARAALLADALNTSFDISDFPELPLSYGRVERYDVRLSPSEGTAGLSFLLWSPHSRPHKMRLAFDRERKFSRADLNDAVKGNLLDDCLSDAVIYAGANGDPIRQDMSAAVCDLLGGTLRTADPDTGAKLPFCEIRPEAGQPLVFITESLGSKVLFDTVRDLRMAAVAHDRSAIGGASEARLLSRLADTLAIYMMANQVPLLDLADRSAPDVPTDRALAAPSSSLGDFVAAIRAARSERARPVPWRPREVIIVAFTDPNDLLSYHLLPEIWSSEGVNFINVIVSNAPTWFGLIEDPRPAHQDYGVNPSVRELLVRGYPATSG